MRSIRIKRQSQIPKVLEYDEILLLPNGKGVRTDSVFGSLSNQKKYPNRPKFGEFEADGRRKPRVLPGLEVIDDPPLLTRAQVREFIGDQKVLEGKDFSSRKEFLQFLADRKFYIIVKAR